MKTIALYVAALLAMSGAAQASIAISPVLKVTIANEDGTNVQNHNFTNQGTAVNPTPSSFVPTTTPGIYTLNSATSWHSSDSAFLSIDAASFDVDPSLSFDITATNNSSITKVYTYTFDTPLLPQLSGNITSHADLTATLTDLNGNTVTFVKPVPASGNIFTSYDSNANGDTVSKNVDIGTAISLSTAFGNVTQTFSKDGSLIGDLTSPFDSATAVLIFSLSAGDKVHFVGNLVQTVPVPGAFWLFSSVLMGLGAVRKKKQSV